MSNSEPPAGGRYLTEYSILAAVRRTVVTKGPGVVAENYPAAMGRTVVSNEPKLWLKNIQRLEAGLWSVNWSPRWYAVWWDKALVLVRV